MFDFEKDRDTIENKYHKAGEPFDAYNRMAYHGYDFDETTGMSDEEILNGLGKLSAEICDLPHPVQKAKCMKYVLDNTRIDVNSSDFFVGFYSVNRLISKFSSKKWSKEVLGEILPKVGQKVTEFSNAGAATMWADFDHVVPDWDSLLELGFAGIRRRAADYRGMHENDGSLDDNMRAFFDGIDITYGAIIDVIDRLYGYAISHPSAKTPLVSKCLIHLRDGAPTDIYEAMQLIYIYFMISECFDCYQVRSLGNGLDSTLRKFYEKDISDGRFMRSEIKELLAYFMLQWSATGNYWGQPFYLGGTNKDKSTRYCDLSRDILEVYDDIGIYNPKIQIKVTHDTPDWVLDKVFDMIRRGRNSFVFCCEPGMIKAVMSYGATYDEARDIDIRGCYETGVRSNEVCTSSGYVNAPKAVEYVFANGFDKCTGKQIGLKTAELSTLKTFEDFYAEVLKQWSHLIETTIECGCCFEKYLGYMNPSNMYSGTIENSLKIGSDAYQSGVKFNNSHILNCGFATLVDSIMAVKEFVYDKKEVTLDEMKKALDADWNGYESLRTKVCASTHKYGNDDAETDIYAKALATYFANKVNNRPNARGGIYKAVTHSAMMFRWQGEKTLATPDGRHAYDEVSKNASPSVGMDKNGVTALINSVVKLNPTLFPESFCLDVMLHPTAVSGDEGLEIMKALLFAYMDGDGMSMQFNVLSAETLRDAQKHPKKYRNLQVRVCGWNVLWNNLSPDEQESYITRAENI